MPAWRLALVLIALAAVVVAAGSVAFHDSISRTALDLWGDRLVARHVASGIQLAALDVADPLAVTVLTVLAVVAAVLLRRRRLAILAAAGPLTALAITELVLKPLVHRRFAQFDGTHGLTGNCFPSGHETGLSSLTLLLAIGVGTLTTVAAVRVLAYVAAGMVDTVGAVGLVGRDFHLVTDVIAALGVSTAVLLGLGLLLDRAGERGRAGVAAVSSPAA
ncbi:MAG: hypothetical protein ACTHMS_08080 [Jatrophihabitans sp.]|uniref:hypothetical protein n=1 Tax=Jatrophihabitans sp. TaxID=1932789 RepID=UPI003F81C993